MRSFESLPVTMRPEIFVYTSLLNVVKTLGASSTQHQFPVAWAGVHRVVSHLDAPIRLSDAA
jgi:hypothetical protein